MRLRSEVVDELKQTPEGKHLGRLIVTPAVLLDFFRYEGGTVHRVWHDESNSPNISFVVEHPDMPLVKEGQAIPVVTPDYVRCRDYERVRNDHDG